MVKLDLHYKPPFYFMEISLAYFDPPVYLILPDLPTPCLLGPKMFILDPRVLVFQNK